MRPETRDAALTTHRAGPTTENDLTLNVSTSEDLRGPDLDPRLQCLGLSLLQVIFQIATRGQIRATQISLKLSSKSAAERIKPLPMALTCLSSLPSGSSQGPVIYPKAFLSPASLCLSSPPGQTPLGLQDANRREATHPVFGGVLQHGTPLLSRLQPRTCHIK